VDVQVHSIGAAKSLVGGYLYIIPMVLPVPDPQTGHLDKIMAFASGPVTVEDPKVPTAGVVKHGTQSGAQLTRDVMAQFLDNFGRITLVINDDNASWPMSNNLAALVNGVLAPSGPNIARAVDQKNVVIEVPENERADPASFISQVLQSYIDPSQIGGPAKVVINEKLKNITITGDVTISPVVISHRGLKITTITPEPKPTAQNPKVTASSFIALDPQHRGGAKLADLMNAFNQLNVEPEDRIAIIRQIARAGKLHAQLIEE
jgi:flagellar P-ring protein precursor FlgI